MRSQSLIVLAGISLLHASSLDEGRDAWMDGLPSIAIAKLSALDPATLDKVSRSERAILLAQSHLATGDPAAAVSALEDIHSPRSPAVRFWLAQSHAALNRPDEAGALYAALVDDAEFGRSAVIGQARMLAASGRIGQAIEILQGASPLRARLDLATYYLADNQPAKTLSTLAALPDPGKADSAERDYLIARAAAELGDARGALDALDRIESPPPSIAAKIAILAAECKVAMGETNDAEDILEKFIDSHPFDRQLREVFRRIDGIYASETSPSSSELKRWADQEKFPGRAAAANHYLARNELRLSRFDRAESAFQAVLKKFPEDPLVKSARMALSSLLLSQNRAKEALAVLEPGMEFQRGLALAAMGDYSGAAAAFDADPSPGAKFNAALARILAGEDPGEAASPELRLANALAAAARRDPSAAADLEALSTSRDKELSATARLALAEWHYLGLDYAQAHANLQQISNPPPVVAGRAKALQVFLDDDGSVDSIPQIVKDAEDFVAKNPDSALLPEVVMKLAEVQYRSGNYVAARANFEKVVALRPGSPIAQSAQFMAAQAAARTMTPESKQEAIELYEDLARAGGDMGLRARFEQGLLLNALGQPAEAASVFDNILTSHPPKELRYATLIEKGDTLFSLGPANPASYREAIATWRLAAEPEAPVRWRNQALTKIGAASEKLGEFPAALASYYDVISEPAGKEPEYFWFYKAGFDGARLLLSQGKLDEAIALYEKLAATDGPRAEEARQKINRLRLENFLWEEKE